LPIVEICGKEYLVDIENRLFNEFRNPESSIWFYSEKGKQLVKKCSGKEWHSFGVDRSTVKSGEQEKVECPHCGCKMSIEENQMNCGNT